ncbi:MAG TPA: hypothetical protein VG448_04120 [Solirubrobacterales bacterium]|nr:hypothetical protein [Solirubrobacterales bacterium]
MPVASLIQWLDSHGGSLTALATLVLCLITAFYVVVTYLLLKEQRLQVRDAEVVRELAEATETKGATLKVRNLGPGMAVDLTLLAGPGRPLPNGVTVNNRGPGFNLSSGESRNWQMTWTLPPPSCEIWLTLTYLDRDRAFMYLQPFVVRLSPQGVGMGTGWSGRLSARGFRKLSSRSVLWWKRPFFRLSNRKKKLHEMFIDPQARTLLSKEVQTKLEEAIEWEAGYRESFGEL